MFEHKTLKELQDYFLPYSKRLNPGVYFYRINGYNDDIKHFLIRYYEEARKMGVVIEGKIPNPDENNVSYYEEMIGTDFQLNLDFFTACLVKWLPGISEKQRNNIAMALYDTLCEMHNAGKNLDMLKNAYIKFMCWFYYKFPSIINQLGKEQIPKILYEGTISKYELFLMSILSKAGCDIVLLQYAGDEAYRQIDNGQTISNIYEATDMGAFPEGFCIRRIRQEMEESTRAQSLYGALPKQQNATNVWLEGKGLTDILKPVEQRGEDSRFFYNALIRIRGTEDKVNYQQELYQFYKQMIASKRNIVIVEQEISLPDNAEIAAIRRKNYETDTQMLADLASNVVYVPNLEIQKNMKKAFLDCMLEEVRENNLSINRAVNKAVYLLCWLKRYQDLLFRNSKEADISCFVYLGGCRNENEALFLKLLSKIQVDVLILVPDLNRNCCLQADNLYEIRYTDSVRIDRFPKDAANMQMATAAYHAERELDTMMYRDSGIYRDMQCQKAVSVTLQSIYEEIGILWNEEVRYRPNFSVNEDVVTLPVIFAKISGVKEGKVQEYWLEIKKLITPDTIVVKGVPFVQAEKGRQVSSQIVGFLKNGKLQKQKIKESNLYTYGFLRQEVQEHILDKLQILLEQKIINGTYENGMEYVIIATILNMQKDILRLIQKFDFTKKNPKLIYINTTETMISLEDSILIAFLNLIGFDIVFFVPTGYQCVEKYFAKNIMEEHQLGEYMYDLRVPDFDKKSVNVYRSWRDKIFKRGNGDGIRF